MNRLTDWRSRAEVLADIVYFNYSPQAIERQSQQVYVWDIDKTYLDTSFASLRELWNTAVEKAFQKRNIPGTRTLVMALREAWQETAGPAVPFPIFFITASPPQMERQIKEKLELDGIRPFGAFFKDNLRNLKPKRLWRLTHQIGYKLQALLVLRLRLHPDVRQVLWGDDSETDAIIYNLYSELCARRVGPADCREILRALRVTGEQTDAILNLQSQIPEHDPVEKIYINLAVDTDPEYYLKFGRRTVATYDSFQISLDLMQDNRLRPTQVAQVAIDLQRNYGYSTDQLQMAFDDLVRRQILGEKAVNDVLPVLKGEQILPNDYLPSMTPRKIVREEGGRVFELEGHHEPWVSTQIDYIRDSR